MKQQPLRCNEVPITEEPSKSILERIANLEECNTLIARKVADLEHQVKRLQELVGA